MKIGVIADTHCKELSDNLLSALKSCDLIFHAGDLIDLHVLEDLSKLSKTEAVYGNMDPHEVRCKLPDKKIVTVEGKKICMMHGYGSPNGLVEILKKEFFEKKPDIIVFGHSHSPLNEYIEGVLFFNPGSATDIVFAPYRSYGIIEINNGKIDAKIHRL